ncbi:MAG: hypothetical protein J7J71_08105 [Deltaproteobacteria bacterium]|nr:hypothetical protein [Candidatus Tharpella sp.]
MTESEKITRKQRIDTKLNSSLLNWQIIPHADVISERASAIIVAHNHPHGELKPSNKDILVTQRIKASAKIHGINLLDHIIFNTKGYYSFVENGEL